MVSTRRPAPNVPNVSTPSQCSTPPRSDARMRGATHSDIERCAPCRREVGKRSVVNGCRSANASTPHRPPHGAGEVNAALTRGRSGQKRHATAMRSPPPVQAPLDTSTSRLSAATTPRAAKLQRSVGISERSATVARSSTRPDGTGTNVSSADDADGSSRS